jgi:hypothetical protein
MNRLLITSALAGLAAAVPALAFATTAPLERYRIDPSAPSDLRLQIDDGAAASYAPINIAGATINPVTPPINSPSANISRAGESYNRYRLNRVRPGVSNKSRARGTSRSITRSPGTSSRSLRPGSRLGGTNRP